MCSKSIGNYTSFYGVLPEILHLDASLPLRHATRGFGLFEATFQVDRKSLQRTEPGNAALRPPDQAVHGNAPSADEWMTS
jgi:hypothetical protein